MLRRTDSGANDSIYGIQENCATCDRVFNWEDLYEVSKFVCDGCNAGPIHYEREVEEQVRAAFARVELNPDAMRNRPAVTELMWQGRVAAAQTVADVAIRRMHIAEGDAALLRAKQRVLEKRIEDLEARLRTVTASCKWISNHASGISVEATEIVRHAATDLEDLNSSKARQDWYDDETCLSEMRGPVDFSGAPMQARCVSTSAPGLAR